MPCDGASCPGRCIGDDEVGGVAKLLEDAPPAAVRAFAHSAAMCHALWLSGARRALRSPPHSSALRIAPGEGTLDGLLDRRFDLGRLCTSGERLSSRPSCCPLDRDGAA